MDIETVILYSELCRLCLDEKGVNDLYKNKELIQDIYLCTGIKVIVSNNWPRKICTKCLKTVRSAKDLRILATASETRLKLILENDDALQIDETPDYSTDGSFIANIKERAEKEVKENSSKRNRSSSVENEAPAKKIVVRKDLFNSTTPSPSQGQCTSYVEGTKYGISKQYTVNSESDVTISYTCAWCPKTFPSWKQIYCHRRLHNKHIPCTVGSCEKKFSTKGDLEKHIRTHTGEKPFSCDICEKSFSQRSTLRVHREMVHKKKKVKSEKKESDHRMKQLYNSDESCDQQEDNCDQLDDNRDQQKDIYDQQKDNRNQQKDNRDQHEDSCDQQQDNCYQQDDNRDQQEDNSDQPELSFNLKQECFDELKENSDEEECLDRKETLVIY